MNEHLQTTLNIEDEETSDLSSSHDISFLPVIALVGRPNVGKSTLFNCLTKSRSALISSHPGTTRDRQYGHAVLDGHQCIIIDTGGITEETDPIGTLITHQAMRAIKESDYILFVVDQKAGVTPEDYAIAKTLREMQKSIWVVVNKSENQDPDVAPAEFHRLGFSSSIAISASHRKNIDALIESIFVNAEIPNIASDHPISTIGIKLAIVGQPNVGKSTLTNRLLGEERVIVHDYPGTTRDSIFIPFEKQGTHYTLIDTAGVRRKKNISEEPEKFSVVKTLQSIESAHVILYIIDGRSGVTDQDMRLLGFIIECGKGLIIAVNKWDGMTEDQKQNTRRTLDLHLEFVSFAKTHFISALHGSNVGHLFSSVQTVYESVTRKLKTPILTRLLQQAIERHSPPLVHGRRIKLRYAHAGGQNPQRIIIHGNQLQNLPQSYVKYLSHFFQKKLKLVGITVKIELKTTQNPYK